MTSSQAPSVPAGGRTRARTPLLFGSLRGYQKAWLQGDLVAGLTVWAVLVPESLAYATIAGVSPVVGLYAAVPSLILYAAFGSSRHLVVGPMSATAALSAGVVAVFAPGDAAFYAALTTGVALVTGLLCLVAGIARLGFVASFISEPVLKGFIVGMALVIIIGQVPALLGVEKGEGNFFEKAWTILTELGTANGPTVVLGLGTLAALLAIKRWAPRVPGSLVAVLIGIVAILAFSLDDDGVEIVGPIDAGLPALGFPDMDWSDYTALIGPCAGVMLVGFAEALGAAKTYAAREGYDIDANRELIGMGAANLGSGLASGMVVNGSLSKTAVNGGAGAKSQVSGLTAAVLVVLTLLFLTPVFESLPEATLAAVVIAAVIELVDVRALRRLYGLRTPTMRRLYGNAARDDFYAAAAATAGVLVFDTLPGLVIGVVLSLLLLLARASRPHVAVLVRSAHGVWVDADRRAVLQKDGGTSVPGVLVVRPESGLFFANADAVRNHVRDLAAATSPRLVVLDTETVPFIDVDAAEMLATLRTDLDRHGATLVLARNVGQVRDELRAAVERAERPRVYTDVDAAIAAESAAESAGASGADGTGPDAGPAAAR
ncbi:SulP family inorganic anion transporter [Cellulosimicrobium cellulans]|uniref:SulP family inorganic anion transporter n=1 Tax=Cellulosimicrobium cellulans TaxID=1710 RepID=UPI0020975D65|nr:SulP family inorganic anion transporter [Cellulosimicrobium cellulans]MCO7273586.1 SulP family inorganic anion transporter [Cellulosimicrobium cellulans]